MQSAAPVSACARMSLPPGLTPPCQFPALAGLCRHPQEHNHECPRPRSRFLAAQGSSIVPAAVLHRRRLVRCRRREDAVRIESGDGPAAGYRAQHGLGGNASRDRGGERGLACLARKDREGARGHTAQMARPDDGQSGRSCHPDDVRAGQAADGVARGNRIRRLLHRVVRRGSPAHLRRYDSHAPGRQAHRRDQGADRRVRRDHALELPGGDDHAQGGRRPCGGLHDGGQTGERDAVLGARAGRARRARRDAQGSIQCGDRLGARRSGAR